MKNKKRKLLIEISLITITIFVISYALTVVTDLYMTKNTYLSSKKEMIDRDLIEVNNNFLWVSHYDWFIEFQKEHSEDVATEPDYEEMTLYNSEAYIKLSDSLYFDEDFDPGDQNYQKQLFLARMFYKSIKVYIEGSLTDLLVYDRRYLFIPGDEHGSYLVGETGDEALKEQVGKTFAYDASEHSAMKDILAGKLTQQSQTIYEEYYSAENGKSYYIGYTPVFVDDKIAGVVCVWYDWTDFRSKLFEHVRNSLIAELIFVVILNTLLMLFMFFTVISPLTKVKQSIQKYMSEKNSSVVVDDMNKIKIRNEVGVLADSFSGLAVEIDRYTSENLRLNAEKERIGAELELAKKIQSDMLPSKFPAFPDRKEFDIYASMDPAKEVGGDFYDFFLIDEDHLAMVIADVSGKGVPAALFMMSSMILIKTYAMMGGTPVDILTAVNKQVYSNNDSHMFVTAWLGILEISSGKLTTSSAGHEYPFVNTSGRYELFKDKHGTPIGLFKKTKYKNEELMLKKGDSIFVYTDGVAEATNAENVLFGTERTLEALNSAPDSLPRDILKNVRTAVDDFVGNAPQFDDLTMLCIRYYGNGDISQQTDK